MFQHVPNAGSGAFKGEYYDACVRFATSNESEMKLNPCTLDQHFRNNTSSYFNGDNLSVEKSAGELPSVELGNSPKETGRKRARDKDRAKSTKMDSQVLHRVLHQILLRPLVTAATLPHG